MLGPGQPLENVHGNGGLLTTVGDLLIWNENLERLSFNPDARTRSRGFRLTDADGDTVAFEPVYEGEYHSDEAEADYIVRVVDGVLTLELRPHVRTPLTPSYADAFTTPSGSLVRFLRAPEGRVREMSFGLGRVRDLRFERRGD